MGWGPISFINEHALQLPYNIYYIFIVIFINALVDLGFHFLDTNVSDTPHVISHHLNHSNHHDYCTLSKYSCDSLPSFFPTPITSHGSLYASLLPLMHRMIVKGWFLTSHLSFCPYLNISPILSISLTHFHVFALPFLPLSNLVL